MVCTLACSVLLAQQPQAGGQGQTQSERDRQSRSSEYRGLQSLAYDVMRNPRNRVGFSLGANGSYVSNVLGTTANTGDSAVTSFRGNVFANLGSRRSQLHLDYGAAYRFYDKRRQLNGVAQNANAQFTFQPSRNVSLSVSDRFNLSPNDFHSFSDLSLTGNDLTPGLVFQPLYAWQRVIRNSLNATLSYAFSRNGRIAAFGGHQYFRYRDPNIGNLNAFNGGVSFGYSLTTWLDFESSYSAYLNGNRGPLQNAMVQRLSVGGFRFKPGRSWEIMLAGSLEIADTYHRYYYGMGAIAGITRFSDSSYFSVSYNRGFNSTIGFPGVFLSDSINAIFSQRLVARVQVHVSGGYIRSAYYSNTGNYESYFGGPGLNFDLGGGLMASLGANYWGQRQQDLEYALHNLRRYSATVGLQYMWPSRRR
jgi:hypothetical protein